MFSLVLSSVFQILLSDAARCDWMFYLLIHELFLYPFHEIISYWNYHRSFHFIIVVSTQHWDNYYTQSFWLVILKSSYHYDRSLSLRYFSLLCWAIFHLFPYLLSPSHRSHLFSSSDPCNRFQYCRSLSYHLRFYYRCWHSLSLIKLILFVIIFQ